jgi:hypothetical protein
MFRRAMHGQSLPKYLSSDHDPLHQFHQWQANLRVLEGKEIKTVPHGPLSHPFVERLIGTIGASSRSDLILDHRRSGGEANRFSKLLQRHRTHSGLQGHLPEPTADGSASPLALDSYRWQRHCRGLYHTPIAA